jgi:hypothetical protein
MRAERASQQLSSITSCTPTATAFDAALATEIDRHAPDLLVLAGFMRILTPAFVERYSGRMINIHPSLLPAFTGLHTHRRALAAGCRVAGLTVHFVTGELDGGPIIAQAVVPVLPTTPKRRWPRACSCRNICSTRTWCAGSSKDGCRSVTVASALAGETTAGRRLRCTCRARMTEPITRPRLVLRAGRVVAAPRAAGRWSDRFRPPARVRPGAADSRRADRPPGATRTEAADPARSAARTAEGCAEATTRKEGPSATRARRDRPGAGGEWRPGCGSGVRSQQ